MEQWILNERSDLIRAVSYFGFLPFFANEIEGFSVEEMTPRKLWFTDIPGPWEWKGPVISEGDCVYGKFFDKKAGFVSNKWFPDFANLRRDGYDFDARFEDGLAGNREKYLYDLIASRHSILSKDAKIIALEEKISWLEEQLDSQSMELTNLYDRLDKLERQFKILYSKVGDPYATRSEKDEVPPPHY